MNEREFTITGLISVNGDLWPIQKVVTTQSNSMAEIRGELEAAIQGLINLGFRPPSHRVSAGSPPPTGNQTSPAIPPPHCGEHRIAMLPSKFERKDGWIPYYCPQKEGAAYCKNKAKVNPANPGEPVFYRSK